jgi:hypothetical protein
MNRAPETAKCTGLTSEHDVDPDALRVGAEDVLPPVLLEPCSLSTHISISRQHLNQMFYTRQDRKSQSCRQLLRIY